MTESKFLTFYEKLMEANVQNIMEYTSAMWELLPVFITASAVLLYLFITIEKMKMKRKEKSKKKI